MCVFIHIQFYNLPHKRQISLTHCVFFPLLQMTQSGDGRDGETDQMLAYQVSLHCPE